MIFYCNDSVITVLKTAFKTVIGFVHFLVLKYYFICNYTSVQKQNCLDPRTELIYNRERFNLIFIFNTLIYTKRLII